MISQPDLDLPKKSSLYTRTGDAGMTSLFAGPRVKKSDPRIEALGTLDEVNAALGVVLSEHKRMSVNDNIIEKIDILFEIQHILFSLGASVATPPGANEAKSKRTAFNANHTEKLEKYIDLLDSQVPELKAFILPGGSRIGAQLHLVRTITRRCERALTEIADLDANVLAYINRLSDFFFVAARWFNHILDEKETIWSLKN